MDFGKRTSIFSCIRSLPTREADDLQILWSPSVPWKPSFKSYWIWKFDPLQEIVPPLCSHLNTDSQAVMKQDDFGTSPVPPTSHLWLFTPTSNHFGSFHGTCDHPAIESDPGHASRWPAARSQGISNLKAKERKWKKDTSAAKDWVRKSLRLWIDVKKILGRKLPELQLALPWPLAQLALSHPSLACHWPS